MTGAAVDTDEARRRRHSAEARAQLPAHVDRLSWSRERIAVARLRGLRAMLAGAQRDSPWHRARLSHLTPSELELTGLRRIPPMTKHDLMGGFDKIVTDPLSARDAVERHITKAVPGAYLYDRYQVLASGGSSGVRGLYVYDWYGWLTYFLGRARWQELDRASDPDLADAPLTEAVVAADAPAHGSAAQARTFAHPSAPVHRIPMTLGLSEVVTRLNALQPTVLRGYPSALDELAREAEAGRLWITPKRIRCVGEPVLPEVRGRLAGVWDVPVQTQWIASEAGCLAHSCPLGTGMHLNDDLVIVEPVDENGAPVPVGTTSAKVLVTPLFNAVLPLIRFEITDEVTVRGGSCGCGSAFTWIEEVQGRLDESLRYDGGVIVHPIVVRSPLGRHPHIAEYQVQQTPRGITVLLRAAGPVALEQLRDELVSALQRAGLDEPAVTVKPVAELSRQGAGKLRRILPLPADAPIAPDR